MDLPEFLRRRNVSIEAVAARARETLSLTDDDVLFACGSLVEGLGNEKSDVDLFLVTPRRDIPLTSLNDILVVVGSVFCDVSVIDRMAFEETIAGLARWAAKPRVPRSSKEVNEANRRMLQRTLSGLPLHGAAEFARLRDRIAVSDLARHKLDWARYHTSLTHVDLSGLRNAGEWSSMLFVAQDHLGHTVDALLAAHGELNPMPKWRAKLLDRLPASWDETLPGLRTGKSALASVLDLHSFSGELTAPGVFQFAQRIIAFSRRVLATAEKQLLAPHVDIPHAFDSTSGGGAPLPALDFDVVVRYSNERFELFRINTPQQPYLLSPAAYAMVCLFDGETPREDGVRVARRLWGDETGPQRLEELLALVRHAGFEASPPIDEPALQALLRGLR